MTRDCMRFHNLGYAVGNILIDVFETAVAKRTGARRPAGEGSDQPANAANSVQQYMEATDWHHMVGKRVGAVRNDVMQPGHAYLSMLKGVLLEAIEVMSEWYLGCEKGVRDPGAHPPLLDMLWLDMSPATIVLQFIASLVSGGHLMCTLLYESAGFSTYAQMFAESPADIHVLRKTAVFASGWTYIRHVRRFCEWPWLFCAIADDRRSALEHQRLLAKFEFDCPQCFDEGHGQKVKRRVTQASELRASPWKEAHLALAACLDLQNDSSERKHALNKHTFGPQTRWDHYVARSLCQSAQEVTRKLVDPSDRGSRPQRVPSKPGHRDFRSIQLWWHAYCVKRDRALGIHVNAASREYWDATLVCRAANAQGCARAAASGN